LDAIFDEGEVGSWGRSVGRGEEVGKEVGKEEVGKVEVEKEEVEKEEVEKEVGLVVRSRGRGRGREDG